MGHRPGSRREALLYELCVRYGYCNDLDPNALVDASSINEVVHAILIAEGIDPASCGPQRRDLIARATADWLFEPRGRGAKSKLPR